MKKTIITVIGYDQPGIIAAVSNILYKENCNIENISQTILQSQFAGIFIAMIPATLTAEKLETIFTNNFPAGDMNIHVKMLDTDKIVNFPVDTDRFILTTTGPDKKGLVASVSNEIATHGVNIANLKAVFQGGDDPDRNIMIYEIDVPSSVDHQTFSTSLKQKATELGLELSIQHKNIFDMVNRI